MNTRSCAPNLQRKDSRAQVPSIEMLDRPVGVRRVQLVRDGKSASSAKKVQVENILGVCSSNRRKRRRGRGDGELVVGGVVEIG